jgi:hypothetical protein
VYNLYDASDFFRPTENDRPTENELAEDSSDKICARTEQTKLPKQENGSKGPPEKMGPIPVCTASRWRCIHGGRVASVTRTLVSAVRFPSRGAIHGGASLGNQRQS